jgi:hypothetical protein
MSAPSAGLATRSAEQLFNAGGASATSRELNHADCLGRLCFVPGEG